MAQSLDFIPGKFFLTSSLEANYGIIGTIWSPTRKTMPSMLKKLTQKYTPLERAVKWLLTGHPLWIVQLVPVELYTENGETQLKDREKALADLKKYTGREETWLLRIIKKWGTCTPCYVWISRGLFHVEVKAETDPDTPGQIRFRSDTLLLSILKDPWAYAKALPIWLGLRFKAWRARTKPSNKA